MSNIVPANHQLSGADRSRKDQQTAATNIKRQADDKKRGHRIARGVTKERLELPCSEQVYLFEVVVVLVVDFLARYTLFQRLR